MKPQVWDQLKNKTADELVQALEKDGQLGTILEVGVAPGSTSSNQVLKLLFTIIPTKRMGLKCLTT